MAPLGSTIGSPFNSTSTSLAKSMMYCLKTWACALTPQGSRIARREYGSLLSALIDQPQNPALRLQVMSAVYVALSRWEPRMTLDSITINSNFDGSMVVLSGRRNNGVPVSLSVSTGAENGSD